MFRFPDDFAPLTCWHLARFEAGTAQPDRILRVDDRQKFVDADRLILQNPRCLESNLMWMRAYGMIVDERMRRYLHTAAWKMALTGRDSVCMSGLNSLMADRNLPAFGNERLKGRPLYRNVEEFTLKRESLQRTYRNWATSLDGDGLISKGVGGLDSGIEDVEAGQTRLFFTSLQKARLLEACKPPGLGDYNGYPPPRGSEHP